MNSKNKTVSYPDITNSSLQRGRYKFKNKLVINITIDLTIERPVEVLQKVADLRDQLLELDNMGYSLSYFDQAEIVYDQGRYRITNHPFTNICCNHRFTPLARKSLPYDIFAPNGYNTINLNDIWNTICYYYHLQGYHINKNINGNLNLRFDENLYNSPVRKMPLETQNLLDTEGLVISRGERRFFPDKIIYQGPLSSIISGVVDGKPMVAKLSKQNNLFNQDLYFHNSDYNKGRKKIKSDPLFASKLDFIRFYLETGFKVTIDDKKTRIFCNVMEPLTKPDNPDISKMAVDLITNLYLLHNHKLVHCDVKPSNVMLNNDTYVLIDFEGITYKGKVRRVYSSDIAIFNVEAYDKGFYSSGASYRDDLIELGYTLNYFASQGKYIRNFNDPRINSYIAYLFNHEIDVDFSPTDYQTMISFFV